MILFKKLGKTPNLNHKGLVNLLYYLESVKSVHVQVDVFVFVVPVVIVVDFNGTVCT